MRGPSKSYITLMDEQILAQAEKDKSNKPYFPLRPSSAGKCTRRLAHETNEYLGNSLRQYENRRPNIQRLLSLGNPIEHHLIRFLGQIPGYSMRFTQQTVEIFRLRQDGTIIEGSTDVVLWSDDHKCLADAKSVGDRFHSSFETKWKAMKNRYDQLEQRGLCERIDEHGWWVEDAAAFVDALGDDSLTDNIPQINLYLMSPFMRDRGVDHGSVLRYLKNNSECMEIRFAPSQKLLDRTMEKFNVAYEAAKQSQPELAPKSFVLGSQACGFCPYKATCWPEQDALKEYFKTWPTKTWPVDMWKLNNPELDSLFSSLVVLEGTKDDKDRLEREILKVMGQAGVGKVRLADGSLFEVKSLKSPYPHLELRRVNK